AERAAASHAAEHDSISNLSHHAGSLIDQPVNAIADLGLAPAASHHLITEPHATIGHSVIKRLDDLRSRFYAHELARLQIQGLRRRALVRPMEPAVTACPAQYLLPQVNSEQSQSLQQAQVAILNFTERYSGFPEPRLRWETFGRFVQLG